MQNDGDFVDLIMLYLRSICLPSSNNNFCADGKPQVTLLAVRIAPRQSDKCYQLPQNVEILFNLRIIGIVPI
jgi:hypothetical protein